MEIDLYNCGPFGPGFAFEEGHVRGDASGPFWKDEMRKAGFLSLALVTASCDARSLRNLFRPAYALDDVSRAVAESPRSAGGSGSRIAEAALPEARSVTFCLSGWGDDLD